MAECVANEFFEQGDKERNELHLEPMVSGETFSQLLECRTIEKL